MESKDLYCPTHKKKLVLRVAKQGINKGNRFWGCPTWSKTKCDYTLPFKPSPLTTKEKLLAKIKNKNGKINPLKVVGLILMIPIYILGSIIGFLFPLRKHLP